MLRFTWEKVFKESEIGKIPKHWNVKPIEEVAEFTNGLSYKSSEKFYEPVGCVFITLNNVIDGGGFKKEYSWIKSDRIRKHHFVSEGDLIIANVHFGVGGSGSGRLLGTPALVEFPKDYNKVQGVYSLDVTKISLKDPEYKSFLYWFLIATQEETASFHTGTTVWHLDISNMKKNKMVPIPKPSESTYIPTVLSWFDSLIENKKRQNEVLEGMAMAIFKRWFVDFEPFCGCEFVDDNQGRRPRGWNTIELKELSDFVKGKKCEHFEEQDNESVPYLLIETYERGKVTLWTKESRTLVDESTTVLVADGERSGKVFRFQRGNLGSTLLALKTKKQVDGLEDFLYLFLRNMENELMEHRTGSAVPHLDKDFVAKLRVLVPPDPVLREFHFLVNPLFRKMIINQRQILVLSKTRNILLPLLVFGRLRVEEI